MKTFRLQESKTTLLKKLLNNGNITEEQFHIADDFFKRHNAFEKEIDWNRGLNITWDDLKKVIYKERSSKSQTKKKIRKGLEGFTEGKDYLVIAEGEYEGEPWTAYQPFTWEVSRAIASHYVEPYVEPTEGYNGTLDAEWCTAYQKDRDYWDSHNEKEAFIYLCGETIPTKKVAISISEEDFDANDTEFLYFIDSLNYNIWDFNDDNDTIEDEEIREIVPNLDDLIEKAYNIWKKISIQLNYNPKTDRYDYDGSLSSKRLEKYIKPNGEGFTINFGSISGNFDCSDLGLTSLEGAPTEVGGSFYCSHNQLTSLKGAPQTISKFFKCSYNHLTSLKGAPQTVGESFYCYSNNLTSLEGAPQKVGGVFDCSNNQLPTLKGAPQKVGRDFYCYNNELTSLEGAPQILGGWLDCTGNPNLHSLDGIGELKGKIYKDF